MTKVESKRPDITNLATKAALNIKTTENKNKIPDTTSFNNIAEFNILAKMF